MDMRIKRLAIRVAALGSFAVSAMIAASPVGAEERVSPELGETKTATVGSPIWEHYRYEGTEGVIIDAAVSASWGSAEHVSLPAGSGLFIIRDRKLKACRERVTYSFPGSPSVWTNCLVDSEDDGKFDKVIYSADGISKRVEPPVPYHRGFLEITGNGGSNFRKVVVFSGVGEGTIRFSYREFSNDMARPAFTEDLTLPLGSSFPQDIAIKNQVFSILKLDGMGLHFRRVK